MGKNLAGTLDEWREARGKDGPHCPVALMRKRGYGTLLARGKERRWRRRNETEKHEEIVRKERASKKAARHRQDETRD